MPTLQSINASASPEVQMNQNFFAVAAAALFGRKDSTTAGLTLGYYGGIIGGIGTFATIADGTVALTGSTTNYIEATTAGVVSANTSAFTAGRQPLYTAVTSSTAITTLTDYRVILPSMSTGSVTYSTLTLATGTITADTPALSITQTWNNAAVNFIAADTNITNTASGASSMLHRWRVGGAVKASIDYLGAMVLADGLTLGSALVGAATQAAFNTVTTTLNIGGAATAINMGAGASSTLTASFTTAIALNTAAISSNQATVALLATPTTVNFAQGASTALNIGHASGTNTVAGVTILNGLVSINGAASADNQLYLQGTFGGKRGLGITSVVTPGLNSGAQAIYLSPTFVEHSSGTHGLFATHYIDIATVTPGVAAVTNTASLYIAGPMTATVTGANYALWVDDGPVQIDGVLTAASLFDISGVSAGQIKFPATQNASADANTLDDYREDSYTGTLTGCTTQPTGTVRYVRTGNMVTMYLPSLQATSNTTACTITGGPAAMRPSATRYCVGIVEDNGSWTAISKVSVGTNGTITLYKDAMENAFTNSGEKGLLECSISYIL